MDPTILQGLLKGPLQVCPPLGITSRTTITTGRSRADPDMVIAQPRQICLPVRRNRVMAVQYGLLGGLATFRRRRRRCPAPAFGLAPSLDDTYK